MSSRALLPQPLPAHLQKMADGIRTLLSALLPEERERVLREISGSPPISVPRAGEILGAVVRLIPRDRPFTVAELKQRVAANGIEGGDRAVHNAMSYLHHRKYVKRLAYGSYTMTDADGNAHLIDEMGNMSNLEPPRDGD